MSDTKALVPVGEMSISDVMTIGRAMAESGYFDDAKKASQAIVKVLAGREMGFGPFASMTGINIIKGKPAIGGNLMAAAVKNHPKYDYRVVVLDENVCELAFFEQGQEIGRSVFTKEDAAAAEIGKLVAPGASKTMLTRFARNMLFNRAISNGVRWYCPDVFLGAPVYTPDELGATVDEEGTVIDVTPTTAPSTTTTTEPIESPMPQPPPTERPTWNEAMPEVDGWTALRHAAVDQLGYNHPEHVANTLKQVFDDPATMTFGGAWTALVDHQKAKSAAE